MRKAIFLLAVSVSSSLAALPASVEIYGDVLDFRQGAGVEAWAPVCADGCSVLFVQGGAGHNRRYLKTLNVGLGYRTLCSECLGYGANAFFDLNHSSIGGDYLQGGLGLELFGPNWIARANGYAPGISSTDRFVGFAPSLVVGNDIFGFDRIFEERSYAGFDLEAGYGLPFCYGEAWAFAGYYYFDSDRAKEIQGPKLRAEVRLFDPNQLLGLEAIVGGRWSYDRLHKSEGALYASLRVPLGRPLCQPCVRSICRRLYDPVHRNRSIWIEREEIAREIDVAQQIFFIDESTDGSGVQTDPMTVANAEAASAPGDILFLLSNTGNINDTVDLQDDQQLWGFGDTDFALITLPDGRPVPLTRLNPAGTRPVLDNPAFAVILANNNTVSGIATELSDIRGVNSNNVVIDDVFVEAQGFGIDLVAVTNARITRSVVDAGFLGDPLIRITGGGTLEIDENSLSSNNAAGLSLTATSDADVTVTDNTVNVSQTLQAVVVDFDIGVLDGTAFIADNHIIGGSPGLQVLAGNADGRVAATVEGNSIVGAATGLQLVSGQLSPTAEFTVLAESNEIVSALGSSVVLQNNVASDGITNLTLVDNRSDGAGGVSYDFDNQSGSQTVCLNIQGNSATSLTPVEIATLGTFEVYPANPTAIAQSIDNNNIFPINSVVTVGVGVTAGPPCPTP